MYIRCKEGDSRYIIDAIRKKVYEVIEDRTMLLKMDSDNFVRWHPYLQKVEIINTKPKELK